jgi:hypothetical protein
VAGCTSAAAAVVRRHASLTSLPSACEGLRAGQLDRVVATVVTEAADHGRKVQRRHLAAAASARLAVLLKAAQREREAAARKRHGQPSPGRPPALRAGGPASGYTIPVGLAALAAWLLTASAGAYLAFGWLARGDLRRSLTSGRWRSPPVILLHVGLAVTGLLTWIGFLASGWPPVAWVATALLLPVLGLGMATLLSAIPDADARPAVTGGSRPPVLVIVLHGGGATVTLLLALLAAIAAH